MHIVHLVPAMPAIGGAERLILDLAIAAPSNKNTVIAWPGTDHSLLEQDTTRALDLVALRPFTRSAHRRARQAIKSAHVLHSHLFPMMYIAPFLGRPVLHTEHNTWNRRRDRAWLRWFERSVVYSRFDRVVVISDATGKSLEDWIGKRIKNLEVIPNGIDLARFSGAPRCAPGERAVIGMAARFAAEKDHETLIRALALLPERFTLYLGADGPLLASSQALVETLGLGHRVEFLGRLRDMPKFYSEIDIYVQSSNEDGFSIVCVEAMASGLPVLASNIPGLRDTVGNPEMLFAHRDHRALAAQLEAVCSSSRIYENLANFSCERAVQFSIQRSAARYGAAYLAAIETAVSRGKVR